MTELAQHADEWFVATALRNASPAGGIRGVPDEAADVVGALVVTDSTDAVPMNGSAKVDEAALHGLLSSAAVATAPATRTDRREGAQR